MNLATLLVLATAANPVPSEQNKPSLYYIPHTHWEGAVFNTREEYLETGLQHILMALRLLGKYPDYKFTLDQVAYFKPFLERYPEEAAAFRKYIREGRLELVGGMDVMPDEVKPSGELLVRQIQYAKSYCRQALGLDIDVAWLLDTFGHTPQLPQILSESNFKSVWFCRGIPNDREPSEFNWKGLDGTAFPAVWLPGFYGKFWGPPHDLPGFTKFFTQRYSELDPNAAAGARVGLAGVDVSEPEDYVTPLIRQFNASPSSPFKIRFSVPTDFADVVARRKDHPTLSFDANPIFTGTFSSRVELHQITKGIEQTLLNAETFSAIDNWLGSGASDAELWQAWEPTLFNQTHDLASGTMNDHTYIDTVKSFGYSQRLADELSESRWQRVAAKIDTSGPGASVVVFNPCGWARTDSVSVQVGFADRDVHAIQVIDSTGRSVPSQITHVETYGDKSLMNVEVVFVAHTPSCGYATYHVVPAVADASATGNQSDDTLENEFFRVRVDPKTGAILSIWDKAQNSELLSGPANVVARTEDKGDLWELYHSLDGAQFLPEMNPQPVPSGATALLSTEFADKPGSIRRGPAFSEFSVSHPFGGGSYATRIRLASGVKRIDIETDLVNKDKFVRYQVLFPTNVPGGDNFQGVAFGAIERPKTVEYPAQDWVDTSDGKKGLALLNLAMPGNTLTNGTMMLSLMRSVSEGGYNGGDTSETGFELGMTRSFRYALVPHAGNWSKAHVAAAAQEFTRPLVAFKCEPHPGVLPKRWSAVEISNRDCVLTSMQPGTDGSWILRVYESTGSPLHGVDIRVGPKLLGAEAVNLIGDTLGKLPMAGNGVRFDLHPFEIKTIKLRMARGKLRG